jgi:muconolactone delta-isomerase
MRVLLLAKSKYFVPPEHLPMMAQGFAGWRNQYRDKMEAFFFFAGRAAGGGILNVTDEAELNQIVNDWPLAPFSEIEIMPIVDGDVALKQFQSMAEKITAQMGG